MGRYDPPMPLCTHKRTTVRVSSHEDLLAAHKSGEPMAATECCEREVCLEDAKEWVQVNTRQRQVFVTPLARRAD